MRIKMDIKTQRIKDEKLIKHYWKFINESIHNHCQFYHDGYIIDFVDVSQLV